MLAVNKGWFGPTLTCQNVKSVQEIELKLTQGILLSRISNTNQTLYGKSKSFKQQGSLKT